MRRLAIVAVFAAAPAWADDGDDGERPTSVKVSLAGTQVRIEARFAFEVDGPAAYLDSHAFSVPNRSVVTAGTATVGGKRHRLRLEKADVAKRLFDAMTVKPGTDSDRAWVLVLDGKDSAMTVDILGPKQATVELEITLDAPTCFFGDRRYVELPVSWWQKLSRAPERGERAIAEACGTGDFDEGATRWVGFASGHLANQRAGAPRIGVIAGRLPLDSIHFARVELDIATRLSELPKDLHSVIVVDHSRSMDAGELEAQRAVVAAYVRGAPASRVQLVGYARTSEALLPGWMRASHAASRIDAAMLALAPRNGSNLETALDEAARWLARVNGTKRILLFSDERLTERLTMLVESLKDRVAADTLVHVVRPQADEELARRHSLLSPLAIATGGIEVFGSTSGDAAMLLRPTSLDEIVIDARGWDDSVNVESTCGDSLQEGHSCVVWHEGSGHAAPFTITGKLWSTPFKRVVRAESTQARSLARILSLEGGLDAGIQAQVDRVALAVNSVWSLFGQWGGRGGYEDIGGLGMIGIGHIGTTSRDSGIGMPAPRRGATKIDLTTELQPAIAKCKPGTAYVTAGVELTLQEIVAVGVTVTPANPTLRDCIVEAIWDTTLRLPNPLPRATSLVAFGNRP